jgi:hypothetical protein
VKFGVILTLGEVAKLLNPNGYVNYIQVSKELGLHKNSMDAISRNVLKGSVSHQDLEFVFARRDSVYMPQKQIGTTKRLRVLDLCVMVDKSGSGQIPLADFKRICGTCNYRLGGDFKDEPVCYK